MKNNHLNTIKAGRYDTIVVCEDLKCARLAKTSVGTKPEGFMVTAPNHCIYTVCSQFGQVFS